MSFNEQMGKDKKIQARRPLHSEPMGSLQHPYSTRSKDSSPQSYGWRTTDKSSSNESLNSKSSENEEENENGIDEQLSKNGEIAENSNRFNQIGFEPYISESSVPKSRNNFSDHSDEVKIMESFAPNVSHVKVLHSPVNHLGNEKSVIKACAPTFVILLIAFLAVTCYVPKSGNPDSDRVFSFDDSIDIPVSRRRNYFTERRNYEYEHERWLKSDLKQASIEFPSQRNSTWPDLNAGIKKVLSENPSSPSVFILIHDDKDSDTVFCLVQRIADISTKYLNKKNRNPIILNGTILTNTYNARDPGQFITHYTKPVNESGVLVITQLEKLSGHVAQAFHVFCDEITPLVSEAVYLFTLSVPPTQGIRPVKAAEDRLNSLWSKKLHIDILAPLVTRMTASVISILPEPNLPSCKLRDTYPSTIDRKTQKLSKGILED